MTLSARWHLTCAAIFTGMLALIGWNCTGHNDSTDTAAVPRPTAYPRIEVYPQAYSDAGFTQLQIEANDSATVTIDDRPADSATWLEIRYPKYRATLYCTYTPASSAEEVDAIIENREERMALNSGGAASTLTEFSNSDGLLCRLLVTPFGTITPVQFIATDGNRFVLSGSCHLQGVTDAAATDSIRPVVNAVEADVIYMLQKLSPR